MSWLGHLFRLPEDTPARTALEHCLKPIERTRGRPKLDWFEMMRRQLRNDHNLTLEQAKEMAKDKSVWNEIRV